MKPFNASEFISNEETPVVGRNGMPVFIVTLKGRGTQPVLGYAGSSESLESWWDTGQIRLPGTEDPWDLFFAPKLEVVHVYHFRDDKNGWFTLVHDAKIKEGAQMNANYTYLGTITGPIVPPEKSEAAK
jgi:hypothetical protein